MTSQQVALVTGANQGIGLEIARGLLRRGLTVLVTARDPERGAAAVTGLAAEGDARFVRLDVTDPDSVRAAAGRIEADFGRLDVLVNNAGIAERTEVPSQTALDDLRAVYETNVFGVASVINTLLPLLRQAPAGRIVNVSSGLGSLTLQSEPGTQQPNYLAYNTSKSALNALTVQYAREFAGSSVSINACAPGWCATNINGYTGGRTAAQGAAIAIELATTDRGNGGFHDDDGSLPW
ncbi:SDR family oxidoreductase [Pseudonocardiaceae bacterium YIM PH 21723]|nr:SDR family oxidoreductase [Pseudonocardiaceae bacterium YIM PH 21723]